MLSRGVEPRGRLARERPAHKAQVGRPGNSIKTTLQECTNDLPTSVSDPDPEPYGSV